MFNLQESLDTYKKALQKIGSETQKSGEVSLKPNRKTITNHATTITVDSIKKSLVDSGIITTKGEFTHLNIS